MSWSNIIGDHVPASYYYYMFLAVTCVVFVLVGCMCKSGDAKSPYPPIEIIRVNTAVASSSSSPPKLFVDKPAPENKIHLSAEIRKTINQQDQEEEEKKKKTQNDTVAAGKKEEEEDHEEQEKKKNEVKLLKERISVMEKLIVTLESRLNTLEDWVQVESDLQEQDILMRAKAHDRAKKNK